MSKKICPLHMCRRAGSCRYNCDNEIPRVVRQPTDAEIIAVEALHRVVGKLQHAITGAPNESLMIVRAVIRTLSNPTRAMMQAFIDAAPMFTAKEIERLQRVGGRSTMSDAELARVFSAGIDAASPEIEP